jgi:transposase
MYSVGIDWADEKHNVCILAPDRRILSEFVIKHNWSGFEQLRSILSDLKDIEINLERSDGLLVDWMVSQGWAIFVTPPTIVASHRPRRSKDDRGDAYILADLLRDHHEDCRPLVVQSPIVEELRQLTRAHDQLQTQQHSATNQLRQVLKQYYPVSIDLFKELNSPLSLAFLKRFPTPEVARQASREHLAAFFKERRYNFMNRLEAIYQQLQAVTPTARVAAGYVQHTLALAAILEVVHAQIQQIEHRMNEVFQTHPDAACWKSIPGVGLLTGPRLLARIGDNRAQFPSYQVLQTTAGTAPITRRSGKQCSVEFRWACSHPLRDVAMDLARNSVRKSGWARSYLRDQFEKGHSSSRAFRALANRWMRIIWTLWQRRDLYDESRHVADRAHKGLPVGQVQRAA